MERSEVVTSRDGGRDRGLFALFCRAKVVTAHASLARCTQVRTFPSVEFHAPSGGHGGRGSLLK